MRTCGGVRLKGSRRWRSRQVYRPPRSRRMISVNCRARTNRGNLPELFLIGCIFSWYVREDKLYSDKVIRLIAAPKIIPYHGLPFRYIHIFKAIAYHGDNYFFPSTLNVHLRTINR